ncbi:MAG: hypothetical protein ACREP1_05415, partial [Rhodanobacteraceae bacterium]
MRGEIAKSGSGKYGGRNAWLFISNFQLPTPYFHFSKDVVRRLLILLALCLGAQTIDILDLE